MHRNRGRSRRLMSHEWFREDAQMMLFYLPLIIAGGLWEAMLMPSRAARTANVIVQTPKAKKLIA